MGSFYFTDSKKSFLKINKTNWLYTSFQSSHHCTKRLIRSIGTGRESLKMGLEKTLDFLPKERTSTCVLDFETLSFVCLKTGQYTLFLQLK